VAVVAAIADYSPNYPQQQETAPILYFFSE
jgi:hypothetical protein